MSTTKKKPGRVATRPETIERSIHLVRCEKIMFDFDLAVLYEVDTRILVQAVKRNIERFPEDFMFQLSVVELESWRSQFVISNSGVRMGLRRPPFAFSEQGVAMLSSVLRSPRAVEVNIQIMRTFVRLRALMLTHRDLASKLNRPEKSTTSNSPSCSKLFGNSWLNRPQTRDARSVCGTSSDGWVRAGIHARAAAADSRSSRTAQRGDVTIRDLRPGHEHDLLFSVHLGRARSDRKRLRPPA